MDTEQVVIIELRLKEAIPLLNLAWSMVSLAVSGESKLGWRALAEKMDASIRQQANGGFFQCSACHEK